ncbi:MAG: nucleoside triphosphate pyrophosphohydrolase [SAR86 cluster bacterium]|uniref:Nucleoside triphosphate pyrophosphohydrolase n=1 Tax=SAR86 cluster bacterium TaxID=2030880 RepID=A0A2A4X0M8_9GAMM|nr:MAG: nucleoside triphosphate pyrophosphohydrolase [SAR86 cluster bacterium]
MTAIDRLIAIMTMLRDKQHGCPWDLEQTIKSLLPYTLEEVYEVADAIENNDLVELEDELGDLLFQVIFYAQIAKEQGAFDFQDIATAISDKLVRRHPHVFPDGDVKQFGISQDISAQQVVVNWEAIKELEREEKRKKGGRQAAQEVESILGDVPRALPAMERARKLQKRAAQVGFDWTEIAPVLEKLKEEVAEFEEALASGDLERMSDELGDVMFAAINLARHGNIEPEVALRSANRRFETRFNWIETALAAQGKVFRDANLVELDALWEQAKTKGL